MSTTTSNTGNIEHPIDGFGASPERSKEIKKMLQNKSKEDIVKWLLSKEPSEAE